MAIDHRRAREVGVGIAAAAVVGGGALAVYELTKKHTSSSSSGSGSGSSTSSSSSAESIVLGQPRAFIADLGGGFALGMGEPLFYRSPINVRPVGARIGAFSAPTSSQLTVNTTLGGQTFSSVTATAGQNLLVPFTVNNPNPYAVSCTLYGWIYESSQSSPTTWPGLGSFDFAGTLVGASYSGGAISQLSAPDTFTVNANTNTGTLYLTSQSTLSSDVVNPLGIYCVLSASIASTGTAVTGSPYGVWTNAFLSVLVASSSMGFQFGTPSVQ